MRIAFLRSTPEWNGSARAFAAAARAFFQAGDPVLFIAPSDSRVQEQTARDGYVLEALEWDAWLLPLAFRLRGILRRNRIDVVFLHSEREHLVASLASVLGGRVAIVRRTPAGQPLQPGWRTRLATRLASTVFLFSHERDMPARIGGRELGQSVLAELGVPAADGTHADGADGEARDTSRSGFEILCLYDGASRGRTALPIRTVALLSRRHPEVRLSIAGLGSDTEEIRMHAAALDVLPRVALLGERDDLQQLAAAAAVGWTACAGDDEAYAILDMMNAGLPVVAADGLVARRYVADGITGMLVRTEDASLAAGALAHLLDNDERVATMGEAARARVAREFPESRMLEGFDRAARAALARNRKRG